MINDVFTFYYYFTAAMEVGDIHLVFSTCSCSSQTRK